MQLFFVLRKQAVHEIKIVCFNFISGVLRTSIALDRETKTDYTLVATARDGGGLSCTTDIQIFLQDVNDNPPTFTSNFQDTLTIQEDARVNTLLTRVTTVDRDAGLCRNLHLLY